MPDTTAYSSQQNQPRQPDSTDLGPTGILEEESLAKVRDPQGGVGGGHPPHLASKASSSAGSRQAADFWKHLRHFNSLSRVVVGGGGEVCECGTYMGSRNPVPISILNELTCITVEPGGSI